MPKCDLCDKSIPSDATRYICLEFRLAVMSGLRPPESYYTHTKALGVPREQAETNWIKLALNEEQDWMLCRDCTQSTKRFFHPAPPESGYWSCVGTIGLLLLVPGALVGLSFFIPKDPPLSAERKAHEAGIGTLNTEQRTLFVLDPRTLRVQEAAPHLLHASPKCVFVWIAYTSKSDARFPSEEDLVPHARILKPMQGVEDRFLSPSAQEVNTVILTDVRQDGYAERLGGVWIATWPDGKLVAQSPPIQANDKGAMGAWVQQELTKKR